MPSDSLTTGVMFTMGLTVVQRSVGFVRTALFCRLLPEQELGQWSLALSFVMLAAPFSMLGITGSFGRYVEHYYRRRQLRDFLLRTATAAAVLGTLVISFISLGQRWFAWFVFGDPDQGRLMLVVCMALASAIIYNFFLETFVALRRPRVSSKMELIVSGTFAVAGLALVTMGYGSKGVVMSYAAGNVLASLFALCLFRRVWKELPPPGEHLSYATLWSRLAPFAIGLWMINIVSNLFDMIDRYMILHFSRASPQVAQAMVGQYFSSLTVPLLMVAVSTLLGHLVMPYLSEDWEAGKHARVSARLNLALKLVGLMLAAGSVAILMIAPLLFDVVFAGKYSSGLAILPWTAAFCFWNGMAVMAYNYLYCVERTKLTCVSIVAGLVTNIVLNAILLPRLGLLGAAVATASGSALNLLLVYGFSRQLGMAFDRRVLILTASPLTLCLGPFLAAMMLILLLWLSVRSEVVFSAVERSQVEETFAELVSKISPRLANAMDAKATAA